MPLTPDPYIKNTRVKSEIECAFGSDAWYALKETTDVKTWKTYFEKVLTSYKIAAKATIHIADDGWRREFEANIDDAVRDIKQTKDFDVALDRFCAALVRQGYLQLGLAPILKGSKTKTRLIPSDWKLDLYRTVQYVQTEEQRHNLFRSQLQQKIGKRSGLESELQYLRSKSKLSFEDWYISNDETN